MKIYLKVPYSSRREAKGGGALWEPSTKRWYVVSETAYMRCRQWALPLTDEQLAYFNAPGRSAAYEKAMADFRASNPGYLRENPGERRMNRSTSRGGSR